MKLQELFEAQDLSSVIDQLEKTKEFAEWSKTFDLVSTPIQRKNGTLAVLSKPAILKIPREFFVNARGQMKVKNKGTSIWANAGNIYGPKANLEYYKNALADIQSHFNAWHKKRKTGAKSDVSNLALHSLTEIDFSSLKNKAIPELNCHDNHLTNLEGLPKLTPMGKINATRNELVSPLVGAPEEIGNFVVHRNKLTSFEGFPKRAQFIAIGENPFTSFKGVSKHIESCHRFFLPFIKAGLLEFFKVKDCESIEFTTNWSETNANDAIRVITKIVNKHLAGDRDILACQEELIEAGFKDYAKL